MCSVAKSVASNSWEKSSKCVTPLKILKKENKISWYMPKIVIFEKKKFGK
jgi:hypothetical protein